MRKLKSIIGSVFAALLTLGLCLCLPSEKVISHAEDIGAASAAETVPSRYCMRDEYIVYAQHQDAHGYCWNFAATMSASTTIMKATGEYYDFSEFWTGVSLYHHSNSFKKMGAGGSISYQYDAMKKAGLMLECDLPYQYSYTAGNENVGDYYNFFEKYSNDDLASCIVSDGTTKFSRSNVEGIKSHIYNHGSVYLTFTFRTGFIESGNSYYLEPNQKDTTSNHAVSVVGWDDDYQREFYLDGSDTPTVFKGAWIILNSYTEKSGKDGLSYVFYDDDNIGTVQGYKYETDTDRELYFYDKIESGYAYPNHLIGKYYGDFTAQTGTTKQKNIFYDDVDLEYSYTVSDGASIEGVEIYLNNRNVTNDFKVRIDSAAQRFYISKKDAPYGQYKVLVRYGNGEETDAYLNNFFVTHGLVGEEIEYDYANSSLAFNPGLDLEYYSYTMPEKNYVFYTNQLSGSVAFLQTNQSVYSEKNMSIPTVSYSITNGNNCTSTYSITSNTGYTLQYKFNFEYYADTTLQPVNVYYDLGGGVNHSKNYAKELANETTALKLYAPTRPGYVFEGWYLDYGNESKKLTEKDGAYYIEWADIHHLGDAPTMNAISHYKNYYNNSNTVFVYAHWEEVEYHNVNLTIAGEGTSPIGKNIQVSSEDSVRYLLKPVSGWCLSGLEINGEAVSNDDLVNVMKYGLLFHRLDQDVSITATFSKGVYLSLKFGDNVKTAYVIGTYNGQTKQFFDGDYIPAEYFTTLSISRPNIILPDRDDPFIDRDDLFVVPDDFFDKYDDLIINPDDRPIKDDVVIDDEDDDDIIDNLSGAETLDLGDLLIPYYGSGSQFTLVVELYDDNPGYTYVLDNVSSYSAVEAGIFRKTVSISSSGAFKEIDVGSAVERPVEDVTLSYAVGNYVLDHYISADIDATSGVQSSFTATSGQIVYLFIKTYADNFMTHYRVPGAFVSVDGEWYRAAIYVNADTPNLGRITVYKERQTHTVTWANWDGSVIYTETYRYGDVPVFKDRNSEIQDHPTRPSDDIYSYVFIGWDKEIKSVNSPITYTAVYEKVLRRYLVNVEPTENGTVTPGGQNTMDCLDTQTYFFTPDFGYEIKDVLINGESVGAVSSYTFTNVTSDQTVCVEFQKVTHSVNVICGANGSVDQTGVVPVEHGGALTLNITPAEQYGIEFIKVNGVPLAISKTLTVEGITQDTVVEIAFKKTVFNVTTVTAGKGGITPSFTVALGENATVEFPAKFGYRVKDVKIDGVSIGAVEQYAFVDVLGDHTVEVSYELDIALIIAASVAAVILAGFTLLIVMMIKIRKRIAREVRSVQNYSAFMEITRRP